MIISCGVVAHPSRAVDAMNLAHQLDEVGAVRICTDLAGIGAPANHRATWRAAWTPAADWCLVIEDDAILCQDFAARLLIALESVTTDVVSLYAGTNYPAILANVLGDRVLSAAEVGWPYVTDPYLNHAVAVAVRTPLVPPMIAHTDQFPAVPIDTAISGWLLSTGRHVAYTVPSLVDHRDGPTLLGDHGDGHTRSLPRKAVIFADANTPD